MIVFVFSIELNGAQWGWELLKKTHKAHEADTDVDTCSTLALPLTYAMATTIRMMTSRTTSSDNPISHIFTLSNSGRFLWQDVAILTDMFRFRSLIQSVYAWRGGLSGCTILSAHIVNCGFVSWHSGLPTYHSLIHVSSRPPHDISS